MKRWGSHPICLHLIQEREKRLRDRDHDLYIFLLKLTSCSVISAMQVAWLYNIRGSDVSYCPVVHAFAIVTINSAFLYVDARKMSSEVSFYV